jgi:molybdopterin/thiamine biosynthesis adenylyltransferase
MKPHGDRENDGKRALIIGLGVVGLPLAQRLAQAGWQLVLCDIDRVEWKNLTKQFWDAEHVGELKTRAAAAIIRRHAPDARIALVEGDLRHLGVGFFQQVDLVAACVDNRAAERHAGSTSRPSCARSTPRSLSILVCSTRPAMR